MLGTTSQTTVILNSSMDATATFHGIVIVILRVDDMADGMVKTTWSAGRKPEEQ